MLRSFFWFSFLLLLSATVIFSCNPTTDCGCSKELLNLPKIIGGQPVKPHSFPWVVSIRVQNYHICTGSIITESFIITAAHCTSTLSVLSDVTVVAGTNLLTEIGQTRSIFQIHQHPNFDLTTMTNDIAILHLSSPFNFNDSNVSSICLPAIYDKPIGGMNLVAIGWGTTDENVLQASNELRQVTIQAFDSNAPECIPVLRDSTVQFCAGVSNGGQGKKSLVFVKFFSIRSKKLFF